jgi:ATP/ADP translocase
MSELSPIHWLTVFVILVLLVPLQQIVRRAGYSAWWCALIIVPLVNVIALWVFAFRRWPALEKPKV